MNAIGVWIGYVFGLAAGGALIWAALDLPERLIYALLVTGGLLGWLCGMLATPHPHERKIFTRYRIILGTFITGYLAAKLDKVIDTSLAQSGIDLTTMSRIVLFVGGLVLGALFTYVWRSYAFPAAVGGCPHGQQSREEKAGHVGRA